MIRNIKAFGLAFVAVAAMSMAVVSAAQATQLHVQPITGNKANITGVQTEQHFFQLTAPENSQVKCTQALFEGTVQDADATTTSVTTTEGTLRPTYTGCTFAGLNAQVHMNGCQYTITGVNGAQTLTKTAWVDIVQCTAGKQIEITAPGCVVTVPEQNGLSHITFENVTTGGFQEVIAQITIQGITYQGHGALCPGNWGNTTTTHNGDYTGKATFTGHVDKETKQVTKHGHQYTEHICGARVDLFAT